jgi:hypothetical protein
MDFVFLQLSIFSVIWTASASFTASITQETPSPTSTKSDLLVKSTPIPTFFYFDAHCGCQKVTKNRYSGCGQCTGTNDRRITYTVTTLIENQNPRCGQPDTVWRDVSCRCDGMWPTSTGDVVWYSACMPPLQAAPNNASTTGASKIEGQMIAQA